MTFEEHLDQHRNDDGSYDLEAAERARADEIRDGFTDEEIDRLADAKAKQERAAWERKETTNWRKQMLQPALSPELDLDIKVPLGESTAVRYGDLDHKRIRLRKDMRTKSHLDENRAYDAEMTHLMQTEQLLDDGETIESALGRSA